ncbi:MAG: hypothetical protein OXF83_04630 [Anaerolineaceae bacterium]|nr:hypothetical protein [Anaerolineaceae bacterium]
MQLTWKIWSALQEKPRHPLYHHHPRPTSLSATPILIIIALFFSSIALLLPALFSTLILLLVAGVYLLGVYQGTVAGLLWSMQIADQSCRARSEGRFALYAALPAGGLSAAWSLAIACLHHDRALENRRGLNAECYLVAILLAVFLGAQPISSLAENGFTPHRDPETQILLSLTYFLCAIALFYCNHVGAILFGFLLGLLMPTLLPAREDVRMVTVLTYLALQIGTTLLTLIATLLLRSLLLSASLGGGPVLFATAASSVLLFYLIREWAIRRLFSAVLHQLGSDVWEWHSWLYAERDAAS